MYFQTEGRAGLYPIAATAQANGPGTGQYLIDPLAPPGLDLTTAHPRRKSGDGHLLSDMVYLTLASIPPAEKA